MHIFHTRVFLNAFFQHSLKSNANNSTVQVVGLEVKSLTNTGLTLAFLLSAFEDSLRHIETHSYLGAFAKSLRKAKNYLRHVRLSVRMEQIGVHRMYFSEIFVFGKILLKSIDRI